MHYRGVSNGLCENLRACEQRVNFCEHEQLSNFSCKQRVFEKIQMASSEHFRKIQMASKEHFEYFVNFPLAKISLLLIGYVALRPPPPPLGSSDAELFMSRTYIVI